MIVLNILIFSLSFLQVSTEDLLQFPLYGMADVAAKSYMKVKTPCNNQLKSIFYAIKKHEPWALGMLDSSGSPISGYVRGNNYWLGSYSQCQWISSSSGSSHSSSEFSPFRIGFYVSLFKRNASLFEETDKDTIHLGLCLPLLCSAEDLKPLFVVWAKRYSLAGQNLHNFTLEYQGVRMVRPDFAWMHDPVVIVFLLMISCVTLLTISGTLYDVYFWAPIIKRKAIGSLYKNDKNMLNLSKKRNIRENSELLSQDENLNESYELKIDNSQHKSMPVHVIKLDIKAGIQEPKQGFISKLCLCFSAASNLRMVFNEPKKNEDELAVVRGTRFLAMNWLIWLYSVYYIMNYAGNQVLMKKFFKVYSDQIVTVSTFSMDTFFFTGGFFLTYKYYKDRRAAANTDKKFSIKEKVNEFSFMILKRYLRLTPIYVMSMVLAIAFVKSTRHSSLFEAKDLDDNVCQIYWWRNLAYITNLFRRNEMCMSWSWYLSTNMQFFLLGSIILIISTRFWKFTVFFCVGLIVLSSLITGYLSYGNQFVSRQGQSEDFYGSPLTRIGPYLIGMFTGYFVVHLKGELLIKRTTLLTCWLVAILCSVWAIFGFFSRNMSSLPAALHAAFSRIAWGIGLSWIVIVSCTGNSGAIKTILTITGRTKFSKLFYSTYLLSPLVVSTIVLNAETAMHVNLLQMIVYFLGILSIVYFCAFLFSIVFEMPLITIGKKSIGNTQTQNQLSLKS